ncbi:MAG TPA: thiamine phosphate synthase [Candidatus Coprenecus stercoravium]|uniref:Thiamine phosphate synthase n=1 Tax=Candidatus Coprenecus stercoravium TaxID=2840735 RepID=A0A9D2GRS1_9BACT|nr:thiamine phosphate synthase [Candidatus Coprenecus stercoravium]
MERKIVVITDPEFLPGEAELIGMLLEAGAWRVHVRKPGSDAAETAALLEGIAPRYRSRLSLHDHHDLALRYGVGGVHLNSRNPQRPDGFNGLVSRSCHSLEELGRYAATCGYMFLSPVFDSISKTGYASHFTLDEIRAGAGEGVVTDRVLALGGVTAGNIGLALDAGFGGAAVLGWIWGPYAEDGDAGALMERFRKLL